MRYIVASSLAFLLMLVVLAEERLPQTGPATEKRFPPLRVPKGFNANLFACDPLVEYPSAMTAGPRTGAVFVAADYMTGLGTEIIRRDEIRLVEDTDGDGYADRATVFATGFNSIQGLAYHNGTVYVMHAPFLTALRDTNGDGKADERRDLLGGLGLPPEQNPPRLHCANGVVAGHDGWLYLALGDHGCDVRRPEGDRLVLNGGGILRCRPDGRDLHVFATGLRNIYDIALDQELNVFVRDNENDGGTYMIRVCHSFFGADHGYPYLYYERPEEALPPIADLGRGSSAGGVAYLETAFPPEYRGNLLFCEWGRSVVRCRQEPSGSGFGPVKEIEFATGGDKDPYGFKPTDLVVQRDGSLLIADWADGQRPKRGRGRIYRITYGDMPQNIKAAAREPLIQLDSPSYHTRLDGQQALEAAGRKATASVRAALKKGTLGTRGRLHATWILAHLEGQEALPDLLNLARTDPEPTVRAQSIRAMVDLVDPVLVQHRLEASSGDGELAGRLAALAKGQGPRTLLEIVVALDRLRWPETPDWLRKHVTRPDATLAHAVMQALRRSTNRSAVLKLLDLPDSETIRPLALRALAGNTDPLIVDGIIQRLSVEAEPKRRRELADLLTRVYKKPGPWVYWGYRPPPRPANAVAWERTSAIEEALDRTLADPDHGVRLWVLRRMQREKIPPRLATLKAWLLADTSSAAVTAILDSLREQPAVATLDLLESVVTSTRHAPANRLTALALLSSRLDSLKDDKLLTIAGALEDGPVLAELLRHLGKRPRLKGRSLLLGKLHSPGAEVRAAALEVLGELRIGEARAHLAGLLNDRDARVRAAAATAAGKLGARDHIGVLLKLATDAHAAVRRGSLTALRELREPRVLPLAVAALADRDTQVVALECIAELGGPAQAPAVLELARQNPSGEVLPRVLDILSKWGDQGKNLDAEKAIAELQGASGTLARWRTQGPLTPVEAARLASALDTSSKSWPVHLGTGLEARVQLQPSKPGTVWLATTEVVTSKEAVVQFLAASAGPLRVWINGQPAYQRDGNRPFQADSERFETTLKQGPNRVLVQVGSVKDSADFHVRFRRKSSTAEQERLVQAALGRKGDVSRGQKLFFNVAKSQCLKCHRFGEQGERIGPDLAGIGKRFSRIYLVESILEPSRTIAPSFEAVTVILKNGKALTGTRMHETPDSLTLGDNQGQKHTLARADIDEMRTQPVSIMPEGLERQFTTDEFVDLIEYLVNAKN